MSYNPISASDGSAKEHQGSMPPKPSNRHHNRLRSFWSRCKSLQRRLLPRQLWAFEIFALVLSVIVIVTMAIVLHTFDKRPITEWSLPLSLNSFVALLVTLLYLLLMLPVTSSLSQLKWNHYSSPNPLYDFEMIDQASRGISGSIALIFRKPKLFIAVTASMLTISINAIGPLVQQVVYVDLIRVSSPGLANVPIANFSPASSSADFYSFVNSVGERPIGHIGDDAITSIWTLPQQTLVGGSPDFGSMGNVSLLQAPANAISAMYTGIFSSPDRNFPVSATCSGETCSWSQYASLAFYHQCEDITSSVHINSDVNSTWQRYAEPVRENFTDIQDMSPEMKYAMMSTDLISLPNGFNISLYNVIEFHQTDVLFRFWSMVEVPPNTTFFDNYLPTRRRSLVMSPLEVPVSVNEDDGTVLVLQAFYVETVFDKTGVSVGKVAALECSVGLGVQQFQSNFTNGTFSEHSIGKTVLPSSPQPPTIIPRHIATAVASGESYCLSANSSDATTSDGCLNFNIAQGPEISTSNQSFVLDPVATLVLNLEFNKLLVGNASATDWIDDPRLSPPDQYSSELVSLMFGAVTNQLQSNSTKTIPGLSLDSIMNNIEQSGTHYIRTAVNQNVTGTSYIQQAIYKVRWGWFSIPIVFLVLVSSVSAITAVDTQRKRIPIWTDSSIAVMTHGFTSSNNWSGLLTQKDRDGLHDAAKEIRFRLDGIHHVLRTNEATSHSVLSRATTM